MAAETEQVMMMDSLDFQELQKAVETDIQKALQELKGYLVEQKICSVRQAEQVASGILLNGDKLLDNGAFPSKPRNIKVLQHFSDGFYFLVIIAPTQPTGSRRRPQEVNQRAFEGRHFINEKFKLKGEGQRLDAEEFGGVFSHFRVVDSYDDMMAEVREFISDKVQTCHKPFILFLGHGSNRGELCFAEGNYVHASVAREEIKTFYEQNRPADMEQRLMLVFSQCYGHLIDSGNYAGAVHMFGEGTEYVYVSDPVVNPQTHSHVTTPRPCDVPIIAHLLPIGFSSDVHLELLPADLFVQDALAEFRSVPGFSHMEPATMVSFILRGPSSDISPDMQAVVNEKRQNMKRFLCVNYSQSSNATADGTVYQLMDPFFQAKTKTVTADGAIRGAIRFFLKGPAENVAMPVILVKGKGRVVNNELQLVLNDGSSIRADSIYEEHRNVSNIKMVFCCHQDDWGETVMFSNAIPPPVIDSRNAELMKYAPVILGSPFHTRPTAGLKQSTTTTKKSEHSYNTRSSVARN